MQIQSLVDLVNAKTHNRLRELRVSQGDKGFDLEGLAPSYYVKSLAQEALTSKGFPVGDNRINVIDASKNTFAARQEMDFVCDDRLEVLLVEHEAA